MSLRLAVFAAILAVCQAFQLGLAAQRLAQPAISASPAVGAERVSVVMMSKHEGPPQGMDLMPVWYGVQTLFWGALLLKTGGLL